MLSYPKKHLFQTFYFVRKKFPIHLFFWLPYHRSIEILIKKNTDPLVNKSIQYLHFTRQPSCRGSNRSVMHTIIATGSLSSNVALYRTPKFVCRSVVLLNTLNDSVLL